MNYYNPYFGGMPYTPSFGVASNISTSKGLLSSLFGGGKISSFINGTQKTLGLINQAIPLVKQVSPVVKNAKTMFKVMNEFKRIDKPITNQNITTNPSNIVDTNNSDIVNNENNDTSNNNGNGPTFFL